jgi:hypothetical protein
MPERKYWLLIALATVWLAGWAATGGTARAEMGALTQVALPALASPEEATPGGAVLTETVYLPLTMRATAAWWQPPLHATLQLQFVGSLNTTIAAGVYDVDLFDTSGSTVAALHAQGRKVVCYINVGAWEDWRPDKDQFPSQVLGNDYAGWPGEKWLDVRRIDLLAPLMRARFDQCKAKGFDGIEPDNVNGYQNDTGFPLTAQHQIAYNTWLANEAHARGLSIGLKNDTEQVSSLLPYFDWALTEDCLAEGWCGQAAPFISSGKPVFAVEYTDAVSVTRFLSLFCPQASALNLSAVLKSRDLDAWRQGCP